MRPTGPSTAEPSAVVLTPAQVRMMRSGAIAGTICWASETLPMMLAREMGRPAAADDDLSRPELF